MFFNLQARFVSLLSHFHLKSFRHAVVTLVWASVSVPVIMLTGYQLRDSYEQRINMGHSELKHQSESASFALSQNLGQLMDDLDRIASDGSVIRSLSMPILSPVAVDKMRRFLAGNSSAINIMLIDKELFPVEVVPSEMLLKDLTPYQTFMEEVITSPESISDPRPRLHIVKNGAQQELIFVRPILSVNNSLTQPFQVSGLLFVSLSTDILIKELQTKTKINYELISLVNGDDIIFESTPAKNILQLYQHKTPLAIGRGQQTMSLSIGRTGTGVWLQVLMTYRTQAIVAILFISLMLIIIKHLANKLAQPLRVLSQLTESLSTHNFDQESPEKVDTSAIHYREFIEVFRLLGTMEVTIREQFKQLHNVNANLEQKVAERTEELEKNLQLLDKQQAALNGLVQYSIEIQKLTSLEEAGHLTCALAERICNQKVGAYIMRNESFSGYQNFESLEHGCRLLLKENTTILNEYPALLSLAQNNTELQIYTIGSSTPTYQGFIITAKNERSEKVQEALMVLCTMLGSALNQHNLNNKLHRLAHIDSVTQLGNRHYFTSKFNEKIKFFSETNSNTNFGIFVIDVNGLKAVNDNYGHQHGDEMLLAVAGALKEVARTNDTVARVGGDEFHILLENSNAEACEKFANRLLEASSSLNMKINSKNIPITFSFGFSSTDQDSLKNLLTLADERMYFAKKQHYQSIRSS